VHFGEIEEQGEIVRSIEKLVEQHLPMPAQRQRDTEADPPYALLSVLGDAGLLALPFNESASGQVQANPSDWQTVALVQHTLGRHAWMLGSLYNRAIGFGGMSVASYGSESQREKLLPQITRGELLFALALTENGAGSDASAISCKATRSDGGFVLNGSKAWVSDAKQADYIIVAARTSGSPGSNAGISLFLLPRGSEDVQMTVLDKVGNHCLPTYDVHFDNAFVDESSMMGELDRGFSHLMSTLHFARAGMAASVSGYAQFAVDIAIEHAKARVQFGRSIGNFQVIAHRLADMQMRVDQSVLLARELAYRIANGLDCRRQAAQAKVVATETLQFVTQHGMQILASNGYDNSSDMARIWRDSRLYSFGEGSNEIQRNIIARELGLKQEPNR
jgi:alkylation response protein AidB-like acyl-CoA dehydrogenase